MPIQLYNFIFSNKFMEHYRSFFPPDLGPNCLQRLSADNTSRQTTKVAARNVYSELICHILSVFMPIQLYNFIFSNKFMENIVDPEQLAS